METSFRPTELMQNIAIGTMKKSLNVQKQSVLSSLETLQSSNQESVKALVVQTENKGATLDLTA